MGNRQNWAKFQENVFRSNEIISIFCPQFLSQTAYTELIGSFSDIIHFILNMKSPTNDQTHLCGYNNIC